MILVEAKAHAHELHSSGKPFGNASSHENHKQIGTAIDEANAALAALMPGFALSRDSRYQLANRFAWVWKVASMGVPVVLVYLGFLKVDEMQDQGPAVRGSGEVGTGRAAACSRGRSGRRLDGANDD